MTAAPKARPKPKPRSKAPTPTRAEALAALGLSAGQLAALEEQSAAAEAAKMSELRGRPEERSALRAWLQGAQVRRGIAEARAALSAEEDRLGVTRLRARLAELEPKLAPFEAALAEAEAPLRWTPAASRPADDPPLWTALAEALAARSDALGASLRAWIAARDSHADMARRRSSRRQEVVPHERLAAAASRLEALGDKPAAPLSPPAVPSTGYRPRRREERREERFPTAREQAEAHLAELNVLAAAGRDEHLIRAELAQVERDLGRAEQALAEARKDLERELLDADHTTELGVTL